jgi:hypothetical protein
LVFNSVLYIIVCLNDSFQILVQALAEQPDAEVEEQAYRDADSQHRIQPTMVGRALVSLGGEYRIVVQAIQYRAILTI